MRRIACCSAQRDVTLVRLCEAFEGERGLIDDELARRQQELVFMATHDALTGLPNRTLILDRAEQLIARARRERQLCAALFVDLDGFKGVNDGLGHRAGDELLRSVAARLESTIREADTLGRLGGDEFVILVDGIALAAGPELVAERILDALKEPFVIDGAHNGRVAITASIGVALGRRRTAPRTCCATRTSRCTGRSWAARTATSSTRPACRTQLHTRMELEMDLREAVANAAVLRRLPADVRPRRAHADPDGGAAALATTRRAARRAGPVRAAARGVGPDRRGRALGAARRPARAAPAGPATGSTSASPSTSRRSSSSTTRFVAGRRRRARGERHRRRASLTIEITETALMRDAEKTAERLRAIKELGVRLSIDDFGTGYSSLAYLQRFPVDELKIDRSFVSQIESTAQRDALIRTFVQLGRSLAIETIAEGIEDQAQLIAAPGRALRHRSGLPVRAADGGRSVPRVRGALGGYAAGNEPSVRSTLTRPRSPASASST